MHIRIELQSTSAVKNVPSLSQLEQWVACVLSKVPKTVDPDITELTIRIVDEAESATLNETYRHKKGPTNILSFSDDPIPGFLSTSLGDLIICAPLVEKEALEQDKLPEAHWAHLLIHGVLHLLAYDHTERKEAEVMESLEVSCLHELGYDNPY